MLSRKPVVISSRRFKLTNMRGFDQINDNFENIDFENFLSLPRPLPSQAPAVRLFYVEWTLGFLTDGNILSVWKHL